MAEDLQSLLEDIRTGYATRIESKLDNLSAEAIVNELGPGGYDTLFYAAIDSGNTNMVKLLLRRSNLIQAPLEGVIDSLGEGEIKGVLEDFDKAVKRSNLQTSEGKYKIWRKAYEYAEENKYTDLKNLVQNRLEFESNRGQGKEIAGDDRWFLDDKAWFMDGYGRMVYPLYGQKNGQEIIQELFNRKGIVAEYNARIQNDKDNPDANISIDPNDIEKLEEYGYSVHTGDVTDHCIYVKKEDVGKLKELLEQLRPQTKKIQVTDDALRADPDREFEGVLDSKIVTRVEPSTQKVLETISETDVSKEEKPVQQLEPENINEEQPQMKNAEVQDVLTPEERAVVNKYHQVRTYNALTSEEQQIWRGLAPKIEQAKTPQEVFDIIGVKYKLEEDGTIYVEDSVPLGHLGLKKLPDLSNVIVDGNFSCRDNMLTDLTGAPKLVMGKTLTEGAFAEKDNADEIQKDNVQSEKIPLNKWQRIDIDPSILPHSDQEINNQQGESDMSKKTTKKTSAEKMNVPDLVTLGKRAQQLVGKNSQEINSVLFNEWDAFKDAVMKKGRSQQAKFLRAVHEAYSKGEYDKLKDLIQTKYHVDLAETLCQKIRENMAPIDSSEGGDHDWEFDENFPPRIEKDILNNNSSANRKSAKKKGKEENTEKDDVKKPENRTRTAKAKTGGSSAEVTGTGTGAQQAVVQEGDGPKIVVQNGTVNFYTGSEKGKGNNKGKGKGKGKGENKGSPKSSSTQTQTVQNVGNPTINNNIDMSALFKFLKEHKALVEGSNLGDDFEIHSDGNIVNVKGNVMGHVMNGNGNTYIFNYGPQTPSNPHVPPVVPPKEEEKDPVLEDITPGAKQYWEKGSAGSFALNNWWGRKFKSDLKDQFFSKQVAPYYFNLKGLSAEQRQLVIDMLKTAGIEPDKTNARRKMGKSSNPIEPKDEMLVVGDNPNKSIKWNRLQVEALEKFWHECAANDKKKFGLDIIEERKARAERGADPVDTRNTEGLGGMTENGNDDTTVSHDDSHVQKNLKGLGSMTEDENADTASQDDSHATPEKNLKGLGSMTEDENDTKGNDKVADMTSVPAGGTATNESDDKDDKSGDYFGKDAIDALITPIGSDGKIDPSGKSSLDKFNETVFNDKINNPEELGSAMLFAMLGLALDYTDAYTKIKAGKVLSSIPSKAGKTATDDKVRQAKAIQAFLNEVATRNPELFKELAEKGVLGQAGQTFEQNTQNAQQILAQDPDLLGRVRDAMARTAEARPDLLAGVYPSSYKGPVTPDILLNHLMGWKQGENANVYSSEQAATKPQSEIEQMVAMMQEMNARLTSMQAELQQLRAENAQLKEDIAKLRQDNAALKADNAQLRTQVQALQAGKTVAQPETIQPTAQTKEFDVPDLESVVRPGFMNALNRSEVHAILSDENEALGSDYINALKKPAEQLAPGSREAFLNAVGKAYASGKVAGLNDLIKSDKELAWANEIAHAVEVGREDGNGSDFPRIKKNLIITGAEKSVRQLAEQGILSNSVEERDKTVQELVIRLQNVGKITPEQTDEITAAVADILGRGKKLTQQTKKLNQQKETLAKYLQEFAAKHQDIIKGLKLNENGDVVHAETGKELTEKDVAKFGVKRVKLDGIKKILQAGAEKGKGQPDWEKRRDKDPLKESEIIYLEDNPLLRSYEINNQGRFVYRADKKQSFTAEQVIEWTSKMRGENSGFGGRKPSTEYSTPKKLVALMKKVAAHPEFAAVFYAEGRTTDELPKPTKTAASKKAVFNMPKRNGRNS